MFEPGDSEEGQLPALMWVSLMVPTEGLNSTKDQPSRTRENSPAFGLQISSASLALSGSAADCLHPRSGTRAFQAV